MSKKPSQLILKLQNDVDELEDKLNHQNRENRKIRRVKNLKIFGKAAQLVAPYALTVALVAGGLNTIAVKDPMAFMDFGKVKAGSAEMTEVDSLGNTAIKQKYGSFEDDTSVLEYCSKWKKDENGYVRKVKVYEIGDTPFEEAIELLEKDEDSIEEALGSPKETIKESQTKVKEEELNEDVIVKATLYSTNYDDYIIRAMDSSELVALITINIALDFFSSGVILVVRDSVTRFSLKKEIEEINKEYRPFDAEETAKKLELARNNLNTLTRR